MLCHRFSLILGFVYVEPEVKPDNVETRNLTTCFDCI
jgi:hypothetical protein